MFYLAKPLVFWYALPTMKSIDAKQLLREKEADKREIENLKRALSKAQGDRQKEQAELKAMSEKLASSDQQLVAFAAALKSLSERIYSALVKQFSRHSDDIRNVDPKTFSKENAELDEAGDIAAAAEALGADFEKDAFLPLRVQQPKKSKKKPSPPKRSLKDIPGVEVKYAETEHLSEEEIKKICGDNYRKIGVDQIQYFDYKPASFVVYVIDRSKYGSASKESGAVAYDPMPDRLLQKTMVGEGFLAALFEDKFVYRVSYALQEKRWAAAGLNLSRQAMSRWQLKATGIVEPLVRLIESHLMAGPNLQMDETTMTVVGVKDRQKSYIWVRNRKSRDLSAAVYDIGPERTNEVAFRLSDGFKGYLQSDMYATYEAIAKRNNHPGVDPSIILVSCACHIRRKAVETTNTYGGHIVTANEIVGFFNDMFEIERDLRAKLDSKQIDTAKFLSERKGRVMPLVKQINDKLCEKAKLDNDVLLPYSDLYRRFTNYAKNAMEILPNYLECEDLTPGNNLSERSFKDLKKGADSWYYFGSLEGAKSGCILFSLIRSAQLNDLNPGAYLQKVFTEGARITNARGYDSDNTKLWESLLPWKLKPSDLEWADKEKPAET